MSQKGKTSSQQQQLQAPTQPRHHPHRGGYSSAAASGHPDYRIQGYPQQIPPRQHSPAAPPTSGAPHDMNKGQPPHLAQTPPQSAVQSQQPQPQGGVVQGTQQHTIMYQHQMPRQQQHQHQHQAYYNPRQGPHQPRPGTNMQRQVAPTQQMYSTSPAATAPQFNVQQPALFLAQPMNSAAGVYSVGPSEDGYSMYMTSNSGPTHTVWTSSNFPATRPQYQHVQQPQQPQYVAQNTAPYYTPSPPSQNPVGQAASPSGPTPEYLYSAGYYPPPAPQQPIQQMQYNRQQHYNTAAQQNYMRTDKPVQREKKLIRITDPNKGVDITEEIMKISGGSASTVSSSATVSAPLSSGNVGAMTNITGGSANVTPPVSGRSSATGTPPQVTATPPPQPQPVLGNSIAAQFAAQVAATLDSDVRTPTPPKSVAVVATASEETVVEVQPSAPAPKEEEPAVATAAPPVVAVLPDKDATENVVEDTKPEEIASVSSTQEETIVLDTNIAKPDLQTVQMDISENQTEKIVSSDSVTEIAVLPESVPTSVPVPVPAPVSVSVPEPVSASVPEPVSESVQAPVSASVQAPVSASVQVPVSASVQVPVPASVQAPVPASVPAPVPASVQAPVPASVPAPVPVSVPAPASVPAQVPESIPDVKDQTKVVAEVKEQIEDIKSEVKSEKNVENGEKSVETASNVVPSDNISQIEVTVSKQNLESEPVKEQLKDVQAEENKVTDNSDKANTAKETKKKTGKQRMKELNKSTEDGDIMAAFKDKDEPSCPTENETKNENEKEIKEKEVSSVEITTQKSNEEKKNEENEQKSKVDEKVNNITDSKDDPVELKYKYREDQWSPLNKEGKRQYDRDFLLQFRFEHTAVEKPEGLPKIADVILDTAMTRPSVNTLDSSMMNAPKTMDLLLPNYIMKSARQGGGPSPSNTRRRDSRKEQRKIIPSASSGRHDVQLKKAENAWKPGHKAGDDKELPQTMELYRKVTSILNKLTPQKFQTLTQQVLDLPIDTEEKLKVVIDLVFEKALGEPSFSVAYANMCRCLMSMKVPTDDGKGVVNFRKLLLNRCQKEFEKDKDKDDVLLRMKKAVEDAETAEETKKKQEEYNELETKLRRRTLGNIRFIGELFKLKMLTEPIMHDCVVKLLKSHEEESLECLCRLLSTIGKDLDHEKAKPRVDQYFAQMDKIIRSKKTSIRTRFMLKDTLELRQNNWVPRREDNNPKTIEQIHKEAKLEEQHKQMMLSKEPLPKNRSRGGRGGPPDRGQGQSDDGWNMVQTNKRPVFDPNKFRVTKPTVDENIQLGPGGRPGVFGGWGRGSSGGSGKPQTDTQESSRPSTPGNRYSALASGESQPYDYARRNSRELGRGRDNKVRQLGGPRRSSSRESARDERNRGREQAIAAAKNLHSTSVERRRDEERERMRTPEPKPVVSMPRTVPPVQDNKSALTEEQMEKKTKAILEEYMHLKDSKEALTCVEELNSPNMMYVLVRVGIEQSLDRSEGARKVTGELFYDILQKGSMTMEQYEKGLGEILEFAEDMAIDIPKFWTYLAEIISPLIQSGKYPMTVLNGLTKPLLSIGKAGFLTAEVVLVASKVIGKERVAQLWQSSKMDWRPLLPPDEDVQEFLQRKGVEFTVPSGSGSVSQPTSTSVGISIQKIQNQLEHLLLREKAVNDKIFDWIEAYVAPGRRKDKEFIRALMTVVCQSAVSGEASNCRCLIDEVKLRAPILQKFLDNDDKLELQALYALQALNYKLDSPPSLLRIFFDKLYDEDVISEEAFYAWESSEDTNEQHGKGVALKSVTAFFTWLREADDDSGDEC